MTHSRLIPSILLALAFSLPAGGCPEMCTEMGCGDYFDLRISYSDGADLDPGSYDVTIDLGGGVEEVLTCVTGDEAGCHTFSEDFYGYTEADVIVVTYYGYDGPPPDSFEVEVVMDGVTLGSGYFEPDWEVSYPNGAECDPGCLSAPDAQLEIDRPTLDG